MEIPRISGDEAAKKDIEELFREYRTGRDGLTEEEAGARLAETGPNVIEEKKVSPLLQFLGYFWGPIPWMIEVAAVLSLIVRHWTDLAIILVLLVFNAVVGFRQESRAADALEALKKQLALRARVIRDGEWGETDARNLVPGDVIRLRLGD
ncbi:MAG TPA: cation-transporting P-type ATPase, partial [Syntrophales bacterium]|nr:cation-transporting P-type ATPase [Syntrophales bacterium]